MAEPIPPEAHTACPRHRGVRSCIPDSAAASATLCATPCARHPCLRRFPVYLGLQIRSTGTHAVIHPGHSREVNARNIPFLYGQSVSLVRDRAWERVAFTLDTARRLSPDDAVAYMNRAGARGLRDDIQRSPDSGSGPPGKQDCVPCHGYGNRYPKAQRDPWGWAGIVVYSRFCPLWIHGPFRSRLMPHHVLARSVNATPERLSAPPSPCGSEGSAAALHTHGACIAYLLHRESLYPLDGMALNLPSSRTMEATAIPCAVTLSFRERARIDLAVPRIHITHTIRMP